jgi:hypothetical protein
MSRRRQVLFGSVAAVAVAAGVVIFWPAEKAGPWTTPDVPPSAQVGLPVLDTSAANRRAPIPGLPDWSKAGYRQGAGLPTESDINPDPKCRVTPVVTPGDNADDTDGLQAAIDKVKRDCSPSASYGKLSLITLPAGVLDVTRQITVDADYLIIRGAGADPATGTRLVFRPDENTRYDGLTKDGSTWDPDEMDYKSGNGGWLWPGRGLFRVQSTEVHKDFRDDYKNAPENRKDLFEGTVNAHWKAGVTLREKSGDPGFSARTGDTVLHLDGKTSAFHVGGYVNVRAANSVEFYRSQNAPEGSDNLHMRQQIFGIVAVDENTKTITVDKPLEFDVPVDSTSDGSPEIDGKTYESKASPLVDPVLGVGIEGMHLSQDMPGLQAGAHDYGNLAPAAEMNGIVLKWAVDCWVRGVATYMTGSHPVVTEEAKNIEIVGNSFDGAWNKGKGGNGYLRGSRVWDSLYVGNVSRNLRHFTFQWSASGNVVTGNDFDSDLNLHGGWERRNLFERNVVRVPFDHRPGRCTANCGDEGGGGADESTWYPIWWGAGAKAVKWSGATGPQNVFFNNVLAKQLTDNGPYTDFYADRHRVYQFGWDGTAYRHLAGDAGPIQDWAGHETDDFTGHGVDASRIDPAQSLFLMT